MVCGCRECADALPSQGRENLRPHAEPERVFQHIRMDPFNYGGRNFLVVANVKSGWPATYYMGPHLTAEAIVNVLREFFCDTAVPTILYSDNGPKIDSTIFAHLLTQWGVNHVTSTPHFPQSNGHAEASVKAMKALIIKCWDHQTQSINRDKWAHGLLQWCNTPRSSGLSPAQIVFGHPSRDALPVHSELLPQSGKRQPLRSMRESPSRNSISKIRTTKLPVICSSCQSGHQSQSRTAAQGNGPGMAPSLKLVPTETI